MACKHGYEQIIAVLSLLFFVGCGQSRQSDPAIDHPSLHAAESGDVICRLGRGYFSDIFRKLASHEKLYSHIGIVERCGDSLFVYHSEASELTGVGHVKRESIGIFLKGVNVFEVFSLEAPDSVRTSVVGYACSHFEARTEFDLAFDLTADDKLYCTELVANAINRAVGQEVIKPTLVLGGKLMYSLEDIYKSEVVAQRNTKLGATEMADAEIMPAQLPHPTTN